MASLIYVLIIDILQNVTEHFAQKHGASLHPEEDPQIRSSTA